MNRNNTEVSLSILGFAAAFFFFLIFINKKKKKRKSSLNLPLLFDGRYYSINCNTNKHYNWTNSLTFSGKVIKELLGTRKENLTCTTCKNPLIIRKIEDVE